MSCRPGVSLTMQAFSEEERKQWLEVLGGKEAVRYNQWLSFISNPLELTSVHFHVIFAL